MKEVVMCRAAATHGQVGKFYGHTGEGAPSWKSGRGWLDEQAPGASAKYLLDNQGWMNADGWGKEERDDTNRRMGEFVRLPAPLVEATAAAMLGALVATSEQQAKVVATAMAKAACTVPSMMALPPEQQEEVLAVLVEWAGLETKRPYPLEIIGRGIGRTSSTTTSVWRSKSMHVRVVCEITGQQNEDLDQQLEYGHTVHALELWAASKWGV
jgi:hypothetical protein